MVICTRPTPGLGPVSIAHTRSIGMIVLTVISRKMDAAQGAKATDKCGK